MVWFGLQHKPRWRYRVICENLLGLLQVLDRVFNVL